MRTVLMAEFLAPPLEFINSDYKDMLHKERL